MDMPCSPEVSKIILSLLETGLLRIRSLGSSGRAEDCAIEADHIHNLPDLLANFSRERLLYYWEIERPAYINRVSNEQLMGWDSQRRGLQCQLSLIDTPSPD
jgi:hypothetical protein